MDLEAMNLMIHLLLVLVASIFSFCQSQHQHQHPPPPFYSTHTQTQTDPHGVLNHDPGFHPEQQEHYAHPPPPVVPSYTHQLYPYEYKEPPPGPPGPYHYHAYPPPDNYLHEHEDPFYRGHKAAIPPEEPEPEFQSSPPNFSPQLPPPEEVDGPAFPLGPEEPLEITTRAPPPRPTTTISPGVIVTATAQPPTSPSPGVRQVLIIDRRGTGTGRKRGGGRTKTRNKSRSRKYRIRHRDFRDQDREADADDEIIQYLLRYQDPAPAVTSVPASTFVTVTATTTTAPPRPPPVPELASAPSARPPLPQVQAPQSPRAVQLYPYPFVRPSHFAPYEYDNQYQLRVTRVTLQQHLPQHQQRLPLHIYPEHNSPQPQELHDIQPPSPRSPPRDYSYGYAVDSPHTLDHKSAHESREGGLVHGGYSLLQPDGILRTVTYVAHPSHGFQAHVGLRHAVA